MEKDFTKLDTLLNNNELPSPDFVCSLYHKFDMVGGHCEYTSGFAYKSPIELKASVDLSSNGFLDAHKAIQVDHKGAYRHLGNAWSAAYSCQRAERRKSEKNVPAYEIYLNEPDKVPVSDLETQIFVPVKA